MKRRTLAGVAVAAAALAAILASRVVPAAEPSGGAGAVYVGARVCAGCHSGEEAGHQYGRWLLSKHARAHASLARPESREIARLSGIAQPPGEAAMCLGCHATGTFAEPGERDETFHIEDGVQCERCHGPGSEHVEARTHGADAATLLRTMLPKPTLGDCLACHLEKGSHTAVLKQPAIDVKKAWEEIKHPMPKDFAPRPRAALPLPAGRAGEAKHAGSLTCAGCHGGEASGHQFSKWQDSAHAKAWATLTTAAARKIARESKVTGPPEESPACLKCHATVFHDPAGGVLESYAVSEGVGCESCHGAASAHAAEAAKAGPGAKLTKLKTAARETCKSCHQDKPGQPFDHARALEKIAHPTKLPPQAEEPRYKTPRNLAFRPGTNELYVVCEAAGSVAVVDAAGRKKVAEIAVGQQPIAVAFSPDGSRAYVSIQHDDTVAVIDTTARKVVATVPVGGEPHGLLTDRAGRHLYVANTTSDSISVLDTGTLKEVKRLAASRGPWALALSPDGTRLAVTNTLSRFVPFRQPSLSEVTLLDTETATVDDRPTVPQANLLQGIAWHPSGRYALFTLNRSKNLVPMTRLLQGWTITNGLGVLHHDGRVDQVLLDEPGLCFPDPTDVAVTPDGKRAVVTSSSSDRLAVIDLDRMLSLIRNTPEEERRKVLPNHLGKAGEFVVAHVPTPACPRGVVIDRAGKFAYVAAALDDAIGVIDLAKLESAGTIPLGGPKEVTKARRGERIFNSANTTFHRQFSCHTCHPDGHIDGLTYNTEPGGIGFGIVDNRTLRGILDTAPFKWEGTNPSLSAQCGPRLAVFFTRIQPFTPEELADLDYYICTIPRPPNRYRKVGAPLNETQRRGKAIFERTRTSDGRPIPRENRCVTCHFPPLYTDRQQHDVGTRMKLDNVDKFDTPHLNNIYDSAPYLHNGIAETLEEIWTKFNPYDKHGVTNDMTKDQLNDLIEYLKTL